MSVFVHAQGIKTVHAGGGGVKKTQNSVHVVVECPLSRTGAVGRTEHCFKVLKCALITKLSQLFDLRPDFL